MKKSITRIIPLVVLGLFLLSACTKSFRVNTIPSPPTGKLRVYVQISDRVGADDRAYEEGQLTAVGKYLEQTGIYEIVSWEDEKAALSDQSPTRQQMEQNGCSLAREVGQALGADYVMIMERGETAMPPAWYFAIDMINVASGKKFSAQQNYQKNVSPAYAKFRGETDLRAHELMTASYRALFGAAKDDLLATAIKKGGALSIQRNKEKSASLLASVPSGNAGKNRMKSGAGNRASVQKEASQNTAKLIVYDIDTPEKYKTAALILSEALRQELLHLKQFTLVNREEFQKVAGEIALQQTGLMSEKNAVETGKGLAANQVITGNLAKLDDTFILQTRRIDIENFNVLGQTSETFRQGQEIKLLNNMPRLARRLAGLE